MNHIFFFKFLFLLLCKTFRVSLISGRSILLDSIFKQCVIVNCTFLSGSFLNYVQLFDIVKYIFSGPFGINKIGKFMCMTHCRDNKLLGHNMKQDISAIFYSWTCIIVCMNSTYFCITFNILRLYFNESFCKINW
jgi:hypothetical protein